MHTTIVGCINSKQGIVYFGYTHCGAGRTDTRPIDETSCVLNAEADTSLLLSVRLYSVKWISKKERSARHLSSGFSPPGCTWRFADWHAPCCMKGAIQWVHAERKVKTPEIDPRRLPIQNVLVFVTIGHGRVARSMRIFSSPFIASPLIFLPDGLLPAENPRALKLQGFTLMFR